MLSICSFREQKTFYGEEQASVRRAFRSLDFIYTSFKSSSRQSKQVSYLNILLFITRITCKSKKIMIMIRKIRKQKNNHILFESILFSYYLESIYPSECNFYSHQKQSLQKFEKYDHANDFQTIVCTEFGRKRDEVNQSSKCIPISLNNMSAFADYINLSLKKGMGCVDSTIQYPLLQTNLKTELKEKIRQAISRDDIVSLVQIEATQSYPSFIELSESGLNWTTLHFCCRFDSPSCLDYFLKKSFIQNVKQYLLYVNQQTKEGLTCLHLCGIWSSYRCFVLLAKYGGLNLSLRDRRQKTAEAIMQQYGQKQMQNLLHQLKLKEGYITQWNFKLLQQSPDIGSMRNPHFYRQEISKIEEKIKAKLGQTGVSIEPTLDELRLREEKGKLEKQRQNIHCQLKQLQKQTQKDKKPRKVEEQITSQKEQNESQQVKLLLKRLRDKQEKIQQLKYNLQKLNSEKLDQLLIHESQKVDMARQQVKQQICKLIEQFNNFKEDILNKRIKHNNLQRQDKLATPRDIYRKSIFSENTSKWVELDSVRKSKMSQIEDLKKGCWIDKNKFNKLPQDIQQKYRRAKQLGGFIDEQFSHKQSSLGGPQYQIKIKPFLASLQWMRPANFLGPDFQLFDGIDPNDIKQGQLGVCYCLATVSSYARNPKKIIQIFQYYDLQLGFYVLRFYLNGKPNFVVIDDYFPCSSTSKQPLFSKPIGNQIWVLLIQKAWAKIIGSYFSAELMTPDLFMEDLTGSPTFGAWFKDKKDKLKDVIQSSAKNYLIVLTTGVKRIQGIVNNHAYSLLKVIQHEGSFIYKIRNPWGRFEWNGYYGQQSVLWTPQLKLKCEQTAGDDGVFFLSESQILQAFDFYSIGLDEIHGKYNFVQFKSAKEESLYYRFTITQKTMMSLRVTQPFRRTVKDKQYKYSPVIFQLGKIEGSSVIFISQGNDKCYFGEKSVYASNEIYKQYQPGEYFIRIKMEWINPQKYNSAVLSVYCDQQIQIKKINEEQGFKLWKALLYDFVKGRKIKDLNDDISYSMQWMRGQMICYSIIRPESKLNSLKVKWTFSANQLQNCSLGVNKISQNIIQYTLDRNQAYNIGTLNRLQISKRCKSGNVSIQSIKN